MSKELELKTFFPAFGIPDPSPFPMKVMMFMRMHGLDFDAGYGDFRKAPLKKIPFLLHKGKQIPDSELIINYLKKEFSLSDDNLSPEQHAQGHCLARMLEERTYWAIVNYRWLGEESAPIIRDTFFSMIPLFVRGFIFKLAQKQMRSTLKAQGIGRHDESTIDKFVEEDFQALSIMLGDKDYLFGDKPTKYDCTAVAFVAAVATDGLPIRGPKVLEQFPNLKAYWDRAKAAYFSDDNKAD